MSKVAPINITVVGTDNRAITLLKIVPYRSGGFGVILPKLTTAHTGRLEKNIVKYKDYGTRIKIKRDEDQQYSASDIVKFSYHPDGFVQFSSATNNRITSGRNDDGSPKGLGLISWPLDNPISTGASMSISFHGLSGFAATKKEKIDRCYTFETQIAQPHPKAKLKDDDTPAYAMAIYILPKTLKGEIVNVNGRQYAYMSMHQMLPDHSSFRRLRELVRIITMPEQSYSLGISWFNIPGRFSGESGYIFQGPTDGKRGLVASYPASYYGSELQMRDLAYHA